MSSTIIDIDAVQARIEALAPAGFFKTVASAFSMDPLEDAGEMPAVYLYPGYVDADPMGDGAVRQRINNTVVVDIICDISVLREAVGYIRDILIGWEMDEQHSPFSLAAKGYMQNQACGPIDFKGGVIHWQERFLNSTHSKLIHN